MVTSTVVARSGDGQAYLSVGQASRQYRLHPSSLRRWQNSGKLKAIVTPGGHRRILASDLESLLGLRSGSEAENCGGGGRKICLLARVSSSTQGQGFDTANGQRKENGTNSDLERQVEQLKKYCLEKYEVSGQVYSDIGSGLNYERRHFSKLLEEICEGEWRGGVIVATHFDRLMRFGKEMFLVVCRVNGVEVDIMDRQTEVSDDVEMSDDILGIITHFSARKHGLRAAVNATFSLSPEGIETAKSLKDSGYPIVSIVRILKQQGFVMTNKRGTVKPPSRSVVYKMFATQGELLEKALPKEENEGQTNWHDFTQEHIQITNNPEDKIPVSKIYDAYHAYCRKESDIAPVGRSTVGGWLKQNTMRRFERDSKIHYAGLVLV